MKNRIITVILTVSVILSGTCFTAYADKIAVPPDEALINEAAARVTGSEEETESASQDIDSSQITQELVSTRWETTEPDGSHYFIEFYPDGNGTIIRTDTDEEESLSMKWVLRGKTIIMQLESTGIGYAEYNNENGNPSLLAYQDSIDRIETIITPVGEGETEVSGQEMTESEAPKEPRTLSFELSDGTQILSQDNVTDARMVPRTLSTGQQEYMVEITLDEEGKEAFGKATTEHTGEVINILINGELISAPKVQEPITDGKCIITGTYSLEEAERLVESLKP